MNSNPRILLVDDEQRFAQSLQLILKHYNYPCTVATCGREAIARLEEGGFALALLDVDLPDISGCAVAEFIRDSCQETTAIMLTGLNTVETAVQAMRGGAYDFLSKPINHELLLKTIEKGLEHNRLSRELRSSHERFRTLADASWEGIVIHENGHLIEANDQFYRMFGYSAEELSEGRFLDKVLAPESLTQVQKNITRGHFGSHQISAVRRDGGRFPAEVKSSSISFHSRPARVCSIRDMSQRLQAEEEKLALQQKLAKASKLEALGLMAGSVAHDLNNILSAIVSYPELLLAQMGSDDRYFREIKKIQEAGKRAAAVVNDLVVLARSGMARTSVENINELILDHLNSIEHHQRLARYPEVMVHTSLQQNLANVRCSPPHLHKIFLNLIGNALEAGGAGGEIHISTGNCRFSHPIAAGQTDGQAGGEVGNEGDYVRITLADRGPGIPVKDLEFIFDPFYSTKEMGRSGTGLGLAIVWNTVRDHGGWIEVKNTTPGAQFEIYLPATQEKRAGNKVAALPAERVAADEQTC